ncbi:inner-membrane translocator [Candidatus Moduliflexus flocculans]|uniref:Autoinducer 2 import system permease protein LsrD n=1 Tax=Candidatus Moduliflexus flocculans TaxID=1499966 RepID=A0A081BNL1_9BACT|nr:inner-membrane translocator [Candidatus Moduliflexus flocculans]
MNNGSTTQDWGRNALVQIGRRWALLFLMMEIVYFSVAGTGYFTLNNFQNILVASTTVMLLAAGETFVIITGGIDLSVGFMVGFTGVICAKIMVTLQAQGVSQTISIPAGILAALVLGLIPGFVNGYLVTKLRVPPFIATFGMYGIAYGFAEIISGNVPVHNLPPAVGEIGHGYLLYYLPGKTSWFRMPENLTRNEVKQVIGIIPNVVVLSAIVILIFAFILAKTRFGQHTYAIGGNKEAANRAGINVSRHLVKVYMISSFFASVAGVIYVLKFVTGRADAGSAKMLDAVSAVVIGGASMYGGTGTIIGTVIGGLIISCLEIGLVNLAIPTFNLYITVGGILIFAVLVDQFFPELTHKE